MSDYDRALADFGDDFRDGREGDRITTTFVFKDGHWWRSHAASPAVPDGLDVERLARAIDAVTDRDYDLPVFRGTKVLAQALAAEYTRLTPQEPESRPEEGR